MLLQWGKGEILLEEMLTVDPRQALKLSSSISGVNSLSQRREKQFFPRVFQTI